MWKLRLKKTLYILFAASFFLLAGCQSETNKQEPKPQQVYCINRITALPFPRNPESIIRRN